MKAKKCQCLSSVEEASRSTMIIDRMASLMDAMVPKVVSSWRGRRNCWTRRRRKAHFERRVHDTQVASKLSPDMYLTRISRKWAGRAPLARDYPPFEILHVFPCAFGRKSHQRESAGRFPHRFVVYSLNTTLKPKSQLFYKILLKTPCGHLRCNWQ